MEDLEGDPDFLDMALTFKFISHRDWQRIEM